MTSSEYHDCESRSPLSKLNRSRRFFRLSRMSLQERAVDLARDQRLDQIELVHRDELQDLGARLAGGIAGQGMHHLDMLRRLDALRGGELAAQLLFQRDLVGLDKGIEPDAGAAVGEGDDGGVAHSGIFPDQLDQHRRVIDQPPAAAFAVGEIEQAAGDGLVDLLAGHQPDAGDKAICAQGSCAPSASAPRGA